MVPLSLNGKRYHFTKSKIKYWLLVFYVISVVVFGILLLKKGDLCYRVGKGIPPTLGVNKNPYIMKARYFLFSMMLLGAGFFSTSCEKDKAQPDSYLEVDDQGNTKFNNNLQTYVGDLPVEDLNTGESASLFYIREEEKLARDVYITLYGLWSQNVFNNISNSEATHMDAVLVLLNKYQLDDPAAGMEVGVFIDPELQALYNELLAYGEVSLIQALEVGATVEEVDIIDIQTDLDEFVDNEDIALVYESLMKGSRNHLRSFVRNLQQQGVTYTPQYLDQATYESIINSDMETGN